MPHQCTTCGHAFDDGSKAMLDGCPECGGNKFQFYPEGTSVPDDPPADADPAPNADANQDAGGATESVAAATKTESTGAAVASKVGRATTKVRDFVSGSSDPNPDAPWPDDEDELDEFDEDLDEEFGEPIDSEGIIDADARREAEENAAQADARTGVATDEEVEAARQVTDAATAAAEPETTEEATPEPLEDESEEDSFAEAPADPDLTELRRQLNDQFESIKIVEPGQYELNLMELYDREEYIIALQENGRYVIQVPEEWLGTDDR